MHFLIEKLPKRRDTPNSDSINPLKVQGPMVTCDFCQECWHIIGRNISFMVSSLLEHGHTLKEINKTFLC